MILLALILADSSFQTGWSSDFADLARWFGVPGAMLVVLLFFMHRKIIVFGWILRDKETDCDKREAEWAGRYEELKVEKNMWRDTAIGHLKVAERATSAAEQMGTMATDAAKR